MKLAHKISILVSILPLAGCVSHLSKDQCLTTNWQQNGYSDGERGAFHSNLAKEVNDCARFKLTVDHQAYNKGWEEGVRVFCQPERAIQLGAQGKEFNPVCPEDLAQPFERAWRDGLREFCIPETGYRLGRSGAKLPSFCSPEQTVEFTNAYHDGYRQYKRVESLRSEVNSIQNEMNRKEREISECRHQIDHLNHKLADARVNQEDRFAQAAYHREIHELDRRIQDNQHALTRLSIQKMAAQKQLSRAESQG